MRSPTCRPTASIRLPPPTPEAATHPGPRASRARYTAGMDGADWLRTQLTSFGCAACGEAYAPDGIRVLAERDGLFFVDLACDGCRSQATAIVTITVDEDAAPRADAPELTAPHDVSVTSRPPVDADDLLDVHRLLADFQGDMTGLLRRLDGVEETLAR